MDASDTATGVVDTYLDDLDQAVLERLGAGSVRSHTALAHDVAGDDEALQGEIVGRLIHLSLTNRLT